MAMTFKHSGDLGDIIYSLPTVRAMGGGILYLDPKGGLGDPLILSSGIAKTKLTPASIQQMKILLADVPFIQEIRLWDGEPVDANLDLFRQHVRFNNLSDSSLAAFGLPSSAREQAWLDVKNPIKDPRYPVIISRSVRFHGNYGFWALNLKHFVEKAAFVGLAREHEIFEYTFDVKVHHWQTADIPTLARVIAGAEQFIGNESFPRALAEAMKKNLINEMYRVYPGTVFKRPGAVYI